MTTHCNCNGNLIPSGNDFYLAVTLKSRSLVDGEVVETPFDFEAADTYNARIYGILDGKTLSTMVGLKDGTTDTVIIDAKGVPLIRAIGVEVTGEVDGRAFRAAEKGFISIVEFNGEARVVFTPVTGGQEANLVMTLTFLPSAAVVGKNAYEIWKEEPGNQDKTLADFINYLGRGESAYEIAVRYGYTGTEAEYNMLYFDAVDVANTAGQNARQAADTANEMAAQAQDAAELADAATTNANNAATAAAATVDAAIDNMEGTLNAAIAAQDAEIDEQFATQTALINQKQMEIGAVPSDLTPTAGSTHWVTSGGIYSSTPSNDNNNNDADLDISDEFGNVLVKFSDGHIQTKEFDSKEIKTTVDNTESADFNVADEDGNVVLSVGDGHIKTKNFDSANIVLDKYAKKKTIKYLAIGNSVNQDPACYIPYLLRKLYGDDIDFEIGVAYHGSYTIKDYVELMITGQENLETFSYANNTDKLTNMTNVALSYAISYADWDIVSFEAYQTDMAGSGRTEDITLAPDLLDWLKQHTKDGCRFGLITPSTYTDVRNLYVGWQQDILTSCSLDFLLDYGATKEFLIAKGFVNSDLSPLENGRYIHSKEGFPCEALALTAIHFLADIAKINDKASNLLVQITEAEHNALDVPQQNGTYTSTTEENWRKCVDAALNGWRVSRASYAISNNTLRDNTFTNI